MKRLKIKLHIRHKKLELKYNLKRTLFLDSHPLAFVQTDVDDSSEENEVGFRKLESFELGAKQVAVLSQEVLEQVLVDGTSENKT